MPTVVLDADTHDRLRLVGAALGMDESATVAELLRRMTASVAAPPLGDGTRVPIHAVYKSNRIEAEFDPGTESVTVTSGPLAGKAYASPSRAAIEVVRSINPKVQPNRNGWGFWLVTSTGRELQSIRRR